MHDIRFIRENPELFDSCLKTRNVPAVSAEIIRVDVEKRELMTKLQQLQSRRNEIASLIGVAKKQGGNTVELEAEAQNIKLCISEIEIKADEASNRLNDMLSCLPNLPLSSVPVGGGEEENECVRVVGEIPQFDFAVKSHYELGEQLCMMDFSVATKLSGSRFSLLRKDIAQLERALKNFMLDTHTNKYGYEEISVPFLVNTASVYGTGQLPKFADDLFCTTDNRWLIPTAEVPLTNIVRDETIDISRLPMRFTAYSACFRSEAGSAGRDTRGMIRNHQFSKVELVSIVHPNDGEIELERMTDAAESILRALGLSYRVMLLSTGDMGFCSQKTYDIEVWVPFENKYREISSCSLCGSFQARRMSAKYKNGNEKDYVYTLNGSGLAIGRTIVAILENYQLSDGSVKIPDVLIPYMNGRKEIKL